MYVRHHLEFEFETFFHWIENIVHYQLREALSTVSTGIENEIEK